MNNNKILLLLIPIVSLILSSHVCAVRMDKTPEEWIYEGFGLLDIGDYNGALVCAGEAAAIDEEIPELYELRGGAYASLGKYERATTELDKALEYKPISTYAYLMRGSVKTGTGDYEVAIDDLNMALIIDPHFLVAQAYRGRARFLSGDEEGAFNDLNEVIEGNTEDDNKIPAYYFRGAIYHEKQEFGLALTDLETALALRPDDTQTLIALADLEWDRGNNDIALGYMLEAANVLEESAVRIERDWSGGDYEADPQLYRDYLSGSSAAANKWAAASYIYSVYAENYDKAIECIDKGLATEPSDYTEARLYLNRAMAYALDGDFKRAEKDASKAAKTDKAYPEPYLMKALLDVEKGKLGGARKNMGKAIKLDPENTYYYVLRGWMYQMDGKNGKALEDVNRALEINRDDELALLYRADIYLTPPPGRYSIYYLGSWGQYDHVFVIDSYFSDEDIVEFERNKEKAYDDLTRAIVLYDNYYPYFVRGKLNVNMDNNSKAYKDFSKALSLGVDDKKIKAEILYYCASISAWFGFDEKAYWELYEAVSADPSIKYNARTDPYIQELNISLIGLLLEDTSRYSVEEWRKKAITAYKKKRFLESSIHYSHVLEKSPRDIVALKNRGICYFLVGKYKLALNDFETAIKFDRDNDFELKAYCGFAKANLDLYDLAIGDLNIAIEADPEYAMAYRYRGHCLGRVGKYDEALADLSKAVALDTANASDAIYSMSWIYAAKGKRKKALENLKMAIQLNPELKTNAKKDPYFAKYKDDAGFKKIIKQRY